MSFFTADGVVLPVPSTVQVNEEQIWSSDTGRTLSGRMAGRVVDQKKSISLSWYALPKADVDKIERNLSKRFFSITLNDVGTLTVYRGKFNKTRFNHESGAVWYRDISVDLIER